MSIVNLLIVAFGVSADAFAVSLAQGVKVRQRLHRDALLVAITFGLFQALMPLIGWMLGAQFASFIAPVDHWVVFGILLFIGGQMLWDALRGGDDEAAATGGIGAKRLIVLALATSIDALAVGLTFAFLEVAILPAVALIGVVTAALTYIGVVLGHRVGTRWQKPAEIIGGLVLIGIGLKVLIEHLAA